MTNFGGLAGMVSSRKSIGALISLLLLGADEAEAELKLIVEQARNNRGVLHLCLTRDSRHFPDCSGDAAAVRRSVPASTNLVLFDGLAPGSYAVSVLHDENRNGRMDSFLSLPGEGFGFSGKSAPRFRAPRFDEAAIKLEAGLALHVVRLRYVL